VNRPGRLFLGIGLAAAVATGWIVLSPAVLGPSHGQVQRDWDDFVANRGECLETVKLGPISVASKRLEGGTARVAIKVPGEWISGQRNPGWLANTPCQGFNSRSQWLQVVDRELVYTRDGIGWRIDTMASFAMSPEQVMVWEPTKSGKRHEVAATPLSPVSEPVKPAPPASSPGEEAMLRGAHLLAGNQLRAAELALRRAVAEDSTLARAFVLLGQCRDRQGQPGDAEAAFRRALEIDPTPALPYLYLGQLLNSEGRSAEAIPVLEAGLGRVLGEQRAVEAELRATLREVKSGR
jgi:hypothetical protein